MTDANFYAGLEELKRLDVTYQSTALYAAVEREHEAWRKLSNANEEAEADRMAFEAAKAATAAAKANDPAAVRVRLRRQELMEPLFEELKRRDALRRATAGDDIRVP